MSGRSHRRRRRHLHFLFILLGLGPADMDGEDVARNDIDGGRRGGGRGAAALDMDGLGFQTRLTTRNCRTALG